MNSLEDLCLIELIKLYTVTPIVQVSVDCLFPCLTALALDRDNVAGFNCSYLPIDHPKAFDEMMYVLMCGTGVGFSVG